MRERQRSRIHQLAINTMEAIRLAYSKRTFKSSRDNKINSLIEFLNVDFFADDRDIIAAFQDAFNEEKKKTGSLGEENSIFLTKVTAFLEKAELFLENQEMKQRLEDTQYRLSQTNIRCRLLEQENQTLKTTHILITKKEKAKKHNLRDSPLYLLTQIPEVIDNILLFITFDHCKDNQHDYNFFTQYKNFKDLRTTSTLFNDRMNRNEFKMNFIEKREKDTHSFYSSGNWQLFCKGLDGVTTTIKRYPNDTTDHVKNAIEFFREIPFDQTRLIIYGRQLEDGRALSDYNIQDGATLHLARRLRGD